MPARPAPFAKHCLTQWISKLPGSFESHQVRQYLVDVALFRINDLQIPEMTMKLKGNLYVGPENISLILDTAFSQDAPLISLYHDAIWPPLWVESSQIKGIYSVMPIS